MADDWDGALKEAFGRSDGESILESIERSSGIRARIFLHDNTENASPILRIGADPEGAKEDSRYQVLGEIARGGVGVVYKGRDKNLGRSVALKVLRPRHSDNPDVIQRFLEEAQIGGQLQHPGIVPVYGLGLQSDGRPYFAMKLIRGETLAALLQDRASPDAARRRFLGVFEQICQTMAYAHSRGVVHRDIKPANVMVGSFGEVQIVDWGFAKVLGRDDETPIEPDVTMIATVRTDGEGSQSILGSVMGTPAYMPPEQAMGQVDMLDERSDVFALGAVLCELLTGQPPYVGEMKDQLLLASQARLDDAYQRLDGCGADADLVALCRQSLSPIRADRPRNASILARAIGDHLSAAEERARASEVAAAQASASASEQARSERQARLATDRARRGRRRVLTLTAAILLVALGAATAYTMLEGARREQQATAAQAVTTEVGKARRLQGAGDWDEALRTAAGAVALAEAGRVDAATVQRASTTLRDVKRAADRAAAEASRLQRNRQFLARLEEVREKGARTGLPGVVDSAYSEVFREFGLDPESSPAETIVSLKRMGVDPVPVASRLDRWARMRGRWRSLADKPGLPLIEVARVIDPDPIRNRLRDIVESNDVETLRAFAADASALPLPTVFTLIGRLRYAGLNDEAVRMLEPLVLRHPGDFWLRWGYSTMLMESRRTRDAMAQLQAVIALRPDSGGAWYDLGLCFESFRNHEEAERCFLRGGSTWRSLMVLGIVYCRQGRIEDAIDVLRQANEQTEDQMDVRQWLAIHLWSDDQREEAVSFLRRAIDAKPDVYFNQRSLSVMLLRTGRFEESVKHATIAEELAPDLVPDHFLDLPRRMLEIEPLLQAFLSGSPEQQSKQALLEYAKLCMFLGRYAESVRLFKVAEAHDPDLQLPKRDRIRPAQAAVRAAGADDENAGAYRAYALRWLRRELRRAEAEIETLEPQELWKLGDMLNAIMFRTGELKPVRPDRVHLLPADEREAWSALWRDYTKAMHLAWEKADA